jgi:RES domain
VSSNIWTVPAVESESRRAQRKLWRAVETQHIASTLRLVDDAEEQTVLEAVLEASKPPLPADAQGLHYLLTTPFRYSSPIGSRFRAAADAGVWYGAEKERTACAELGFWRWRFLLDSPALTELGPSPQTVFRAGIDARMIDLCAPPFKRSRADWTHPSNYQPTQAFARLAREANVEAIRYESVRDPEHAAAVAVLTPRCFKPRKLIEQHTWLLTVRPDVVVWQRDGHLYQFNPQHWA